MLIAGRCKVYLPLLVFSLDAFQLGCIPAWMHSSYLTKALALDYQKVLLTRIKTLEIPDFLFCLRKDYIAQMYKFLRFVFFFRGGGGVHRNVFQFYTMCFIAMQNKDDRCCRLTLKTLFNIMEDPLKNG